MSTPGSAPRDRTASWQLLTAVFGCLAAIIGLTTAFLTMNSGSSSNGPGPAPTTDASATPTLQEPVEPTAFSTRNSDPGFRLEMGGNYDLDVTPLGAPSTGDRVGDISFDPDGAAFSPLAQVLILGPAPTADYPTCRGANGYVAGDKLANQALPDGTFICLKTTGKRYVAMRLIHAEPDFMVFDTVTYDPPE